MVTDRPEQQLPINAVKESAHVEIEHPVVAPAALTSGLHGIYCRLTGSVAIGIWMELRLQNGLQISTDNFLGDPVSDCWDTQRAHAAVRLWNIDPPHRRGQNAPCRQPLPEFLEIVRKLALELRHGLPSHASRSLVRLHTFEGFPDFPFGDL